MTTTLNASNSGSGGLIATADASGVLALQTAGVTAVTIDASGNVGIGTSSPAYKLEVRSTMAVLDGSANIGFWANGTSYTQVWQTLQSVNDFIIQTAASKYMSFGTNSTERMRIDTSGNVGIGTTSPTNKLHVVGTVKIEGSTLDLNDAGTFTISQNTTASALVLRTAASSYLRFDTNGANERMRIDSSGNFDFKSGLMTSTGTQNNTTAAGANMFISAGQMYRSTSSLKYKKNVENATHGLVDLLKLRPVTYEGKAEADDGKTFGGLIAEEVHEAGLTEFVQYAEDGSPDALAYGNMVSLCVKAIQEQQALITSLTARIAALESN